jgi:hypothetical protein
VGSTIAGLAFNPLKAHRPAMDVFDPCGTRTKTRTWTWNWRWPGRGRGLQQPQRGLQMRPSLMMKPCAVGFDAEGR